MPNWCSNNLTITGPEADVQAFKAKAVGHSLGKNQRKPRWTCSTSTAWSPSLKKS